MLAVSVALTQYLLTALVGVFLLGSLVALRPVLPIRVMDVAGDVHTLAAALNHSAFNFANVLGAWFSGLAIAAGWGWTSLGWAGALLALGGLAAFGASLAMQRAGAAAQS
jgi:MFS transporter, DHA1 family, inner membrane transport protein